MLNPFNILSPKQNIAVEGDAQKWPKGSDGLVRVPYVITPTFSLDEINNINKAMKSFQDNTCIRFSPWLLDVKYILITRLNGCSSPVGAPTAGVFPSILSLGIGCATVGVSAHELNHAVGFWHEQSRPDRDNYVRINNGNIQSGMENNFEKQSGTTLDLPYDYDSLMHYDKYAFSSNGQPTIEPLQANAAIGQRDGLSELDIQKINKLYECE